MTEEVKEKSRTEIFYERNLKLIQNPRSIVIRISNSSVPYRVVRLIFDLDKTVNTIMRNVGFTVSKADVEKQFNELKKISNSLWEETKKVVPSLYDFNPENWQELNDSYEVKESLIKSKRGNIRVFIPRSNECAQIIMAFRVLGRTRVNFLNTGNIEMVNKIAKIITEFTEKINALNSILSKRNSNTGEIDGKDNNRQEG